MMPWVVQLLGTREQNAHQHMYNYFLIGQKEFSTRITCASEQDLYER